MRNPNGYGSIKKLNGNRRKPYAVVITTGFTDDGKQLINYLGYFKTNREAQQFLANYNENPSISNKITVRQLFEKWSAVHFENLSRSSIRSYEASFDKMKAIHDYEIKNVKLADLQEIINEYNHLSRSTQRDIKSTMLHIFDYAIKNDYAEKNYAKFLELKKEERVEKAIFTDLEIKKLWDNLDKVEWCDSILFMIYTGMRVGEMTTLTKFDVNLEEMTIQHGNKTEAGKRRIIPINPKIQQIIRKRIKESTSEYVFERNSKQVRVDTYRKYCFNKVKKELGLNSKLTPHSCRHTFATLLNSNVANKVLIAKLIGHEDYSTTANIYTHADIEELRSAISSI